MQQMHDPNDSNDSNDPNDPNEIYSYRSASIGFNRAALRAG